jgi:lambda family phage portal protein
MNLLDRMIAAVAPSRALSRVRSRVALNILRQTTAHYDSATSGRRGQSWRASPTDADAAAGRRARLAYIARDMVRNTPFAFRAQQCIAANVVGDGIIPKVIDLPAEDSTGAREIRARALRLIEQHLDTTAIDADGRQNLYGLQRLVMNTVVDSGEALIVRVEADDLSLPLPFQLRVMEPDHLDVGMDGRISPEGHYVHEGIAYDDRARRVGYYLYDEHPGSNSWRMGPVSRVRSRFVPADRVLHIYRQDRPGQMRGVSWFAGVALNLQDLGDYQDAQIMRQKLAACFTAFRKVGADGGARADEEIGATLSPGLIQDLGPDEDIVFADPPEVSGYEEFTRAVLRSVAAGMGITYEALSGDLSNVNFSSARMGRNEMERIITGWQKLMLIPQMLDPIGRWFLQFWAMRYPRDAAAIEGARVTWTTPHHILVDPTREIPALRDAVRAGFVSWQDVIRQLGEDPERVIEEHIQDREVADRNGLVFDSDARNSVSLATRPPDDPAPADRQQGRGNNA